MGTKPLSSIPDSVERRGNSVGAVQDKVDQDFGAFWGHSKTDFKPAIRDEMSRAIKPWSQERRATFGPRTDAGPTFQYIGVGKCRDQCAGLCDHFVK